MFYARSWLHRYPELGDSIITGQLDSWAVYSVPHRRVIIGASFCIRGPGNAQVLHQILNLLFAGSSLTVKDRLLNWLDS